MLIGAGRYVQRLGALAERERERRFACELHNLSGLDGVGAYTRCDEGGLASLGLRSVQLNALAIGVFHDADGVEMNARPYLYTPNTLSRNGSGIGV